MTTTSRYLRFGDRYRIRTRLRSFEGAFIGRKDSPTAGVLVELRTPFGSKFIPEGDIVQIIDLFQGEEE